MNSLMLVAALLVGGCITCVCFRACYCCSLFFCYQWHEIGAIWHRYRMHGPVSHANMDEPGPDTMTVQVQTQGVGALIVVFWMKCILEPGFQREGRDQERYLRARKLAMPCLIIPGLVTLVLLYPSMHCLTLISICAPGKHGIGSYDIIHSDKMLDMMDDDQENMYKNFWIGIAILFVPIFFATCCIYGLCVNCAFDSCTSPSLDTGDAQASAKYQQGVHDPLLQYTNAPMNRSPASNKPMQRDDLENGLPPCPHGMRCYRKNPRHFEEFSHPPGHPLLPPNAAPPNNTQHVPPLPQPSAPGAPTNTYIQPDGCEDGDHYYPLALAPIMYPQTEQLQLVVPQGSGPGSVLAVQAPSGRQVQVTVPAGYAPGMQMVVQI